MTEITTTTDRALDSRAGATLTGMLPALLDFKSTATLIGRPADRSARLFFWRGARNGSFPAPLKVGAAKVCWRRADLERWLANLTPVSYAAKVSE